MGVSPYIYPMFIRQKKNRSGSISVQIIQKIGRINKVVRTIGCSSNQEALDNLQQQAEYEIERFFGPTLFDQYVQKILRMLLMTASGLLGQT
jgi:hypothetical protein